MTTSWVAVTGAAATLMPGIVAAVRVPLEAVRVYRAGRVDGQAGEGGHAVDGVDGHGAAELAPLVPLDRASVTGPV